MTPQSLLHATFRTGITVKGIDGALETIGGVLLWLVKPSAMNRALQFLCQHELSLDPHDFVGNHLLHASENLTHSGVLFASIYLLSHGAVKMVLAVALWLDELWAYPLAIVVFGAFTIYQVYRYTHMHSDALLVLTVFDVAIVWLTWQEYRVQDSERAASRAI